MTDFETHPVGTADLVKMQQNLEHWRQEVGKLHSRVATLTDQLTRANAATAAAYEVAARAAHEEAWPEDGTYGPEDHDIECAERATVNVITDAIRALATPDQTAALDLLIAEAVKPYAEALTFYRDGWSFKTNKRYHGLEWFPKEELLDDCGNKAATILAASKKGGV